MTPKPVEASLPDSVGVVADDLEQFAKKSACLGAARAELDKLRAESPGEMLGTEVLKATLARLSGWRAVASGERADRLSRTAGDELAQRKRRQVLEAEFGGMVDSVEDMTKRFMPQRPLIEERARLAGLQETIQRTRERNLSQLELLTRWKKLRAADRSDATMQSIITRATALGLFPEKGPELSKVDLSGLSLVLAGNFGHRESVLRSETDRLTGEIRQVKASLAAKQAVQGRLASDVAALENKVRDASSNLSKKDIEAELLRLAEVGLPIRPDISPAKIMEILRDLKERFGSLKATLEAEPELPA
ncbi:MAG: hypothetical protein HY673_17400 [Chloroflexi bacterium]|nr:hypothetical protein [Chloroflexota bacterium]